MHLKVKPGENYTFTKFAALVTSPNASAATELAKRAAIAARAGGWEATLAGSETAWHALWETDLVVDGNANLQRTIHSMLFYLLGSARAGLDISTPPMGLSSDGYYGHIFWDADTFMFPPLVILHPDLARPMVAFRSRTRDAARQNAQRNGYRGAMFPWEAGPNGAESTPRFAFQNASSENHVNGDVALAAWQYWLATGDRNWLQKDAWPILRDTADFWASRVNYNAGHDRYEISGVVAVKESDIGVSNDAYTNAVAKKNLELAIAAARELGIEPEPKWRSVAEKMYVPESDSPLLWYPLNQQYSPEKIRGILRNLLPQVERHKTGAMMGTEFYPILSAEVGDRRLIAQLLEPLVKPYLRPPFQVVAETPDNQNTNFITGAGAFLQQFVFGYTGLRLSERGLERKFPPALPPDIQRLTLKNITVRGKRETLVFDSSSH
jgi:trehalose/maltose hydrolase-like predicted phosphorylase